MIASLRGHVLSATLDTLVIEVGGVGLAVRTTPQCATSHQIGDQALLATTLVVREDALTLYGFPSVTERDLFDTLQSVTGVGPRLALAALATLGTDGVVDAILRDDLAALTKVPGIGRKGAARLTLELRDRLPAVASVDTTPGAPAVANDDVRGALVGLGWSGRDVDAALAALDPEPDAPVAQTLRAALAILARR